LIKFHIKDRIFLLIFVDSLGVTDYLL